MKNRHHRVTKHPTLLQQEAQGRNDIEESYRGDDGVLEEQRQLLGKRITEAIPSVQNHMVGRLLFY